MINFSPSSRVWVYQADRVLTNEETGKIASEASDFVTDWSSHNRALKASAELVHQRFLVLIVDESQAGASGCSIDKSVHFVEKIGSDFNVNFFNRLLFSYLDAENRVQTIDKKTLNQLFQEGKINDDTLVFDTLVNTYLAYNQEFVKRMKESWFNKMIKSPSSRRDACGINPPPKESFVTLTGGL